MIGSSVWFLDRLWVVAARWGKWSLGSGREVGEVVEGGLVCTGCDA